MRNFFSRIALLAIFLAAPFALKAQDNSAMTGVVTDSTGAVVSDVTVTLVNPSTGTTATVKTNGEGAYRFANVAPHPGYVASFEHAGFATLKVSNITLTVGSTRTQNAKLLAGASQEVEVSASNSVVTLNTTDASIGNNFDVKLLQDLPVQSRTSPAALFTLQPGYAAGSFTGARTDQNSVTVDGLDVNDIAAGSNLAINGFAPVDAVQEFRGTVAGLTSNLGTGSGGQFQLVTKSGTNHFHGNLNEYHRDTATEANYWFNNNSGLPRTALIRNQFGGAIGGPVLKDKLFFFFDFNNSRTIQSQSVSRTVPLDSYRNGTIGYLNQTPGCTSASRAVGSGASVNAACITYLTSAQIAALDPQHVGFDQNLLTFENSRYPHANDLNLGDGINTGGFRFTTATPDTIFNYVARVDYNLTQHQRLFARATIGREDATETTNAFPVDPFTNPYQDRSYGYVVSHIWTIGQNKVNQFYWGDNVSKLNFPTNYKPTGIQQYTIGGLTAPYNSSSSQQRRVPIPEFRDDFNWQVGHHTLGFGGTFKYVKTNSNLVNDFNFITVGLGGLTTALNPALRPADINANTTAQTRFDSLFASALGRIGEIDSNYNYDKSGKPIAQGTGETRRYRFYQTELYLGDTWKVTPTLTLSYGVRWQIYSVPYEVNGAESVQQLTFDQYFNARQKQSAAGISGDAALPFSTYVLGGKANNGPGIYQQSWKDIAPRFAFAWNPSYSKKTVVNGSIGIDYDRTVINAANFIQDQSSYLFQQTVGNPYGQTNSSAAFSVDPRIGANLSFTNPNTPGTITAPLTPFVDAGTPYGLANNEFNYLVDPNLKTPYSIAANFGIQQEMPGHLIFKVNYAGRFGRRLVAQADASQLLDFPDKASGQSLSSAIVNLETQARNGATYKTTTPVPWFEDVMYPGIGHSINAAFPSNSAMLMYYVGSLLKLGDFADAMQFIGGNGLMDSNVALASQFAGNTFITNKGFSNYNGLLVSVNKNLSQGLQFDFNYTWSHSMDNTSQVTNSIAASNGYGFICDAVRPRECRANSDFDVTNYVTSDFVYDLPFGRGRTFAANTSRLLDTLIGGWSLSGTPIYKTGTALNTSTEAYVAGYANNAPAIFNGNRGDVLSKVHKVGSTVYAWANNAPQADFAGPTGFTIGSRNALRGPHGMFFDAGLAKNFMILPDGKLNLKFRADFYNVMNHPVFNAPTTDIVSSTFGQITSAVSNTFSAGGPRVGQFSLRLEF